MEAIVGGGRKFRYWWWWYVLRREWELVCCYFPCYWIIVVNFGTELNPHNIGSELVLWFKCYRPKGGIVGVPSHLMDMLLPGSSSVRIKVLTLVLYGYPGTVVRVGAAKLWLFSTSTKC